MTRDEILKKLDGLSVLETFTIPLTVKNLNAIAQARSKLAHQRETVTNTPTIHYRTVGKETLMVWKEKK